jgi:hypothetical protein
LVNGGKVKDLQLKLCLAWFRKIKVAASGGGKVIIFSEEKGEVKEVLQHKLWWDGVLEDIVNWSPNMVPNRRYI